SQLCRLFANSGGIDSGPAGVNPYVAAIDPTQVLQRLPECVDPRLIVRIVRRCGQQYANVPHALGLLRAHRGRPRRYAAKQRDELAPVHCPMPPVLLAERIAHLSYGSRLLRCGISVPLMSESGYLQTKERCGDRVRFASVSRLNSAQLLRRVRARSGLSAPQQAVCLLSGLANLDNPRHSDCKGRAATGLTFDHDV